MVGKGRYSVVKCFDYLNLGCGVGYVVGFVYNVGDFYFGVINN